MLKANHGLWQNHKNKKSSTNVNKWHSFFMTSCKRCGSNLIVYIKRDLSYGYSVCDGCGEQEPIDVSAID